MSSTSPDPSSPTGRRANRLSASDWGALVDLDPRLSEGLLDRLEAAGVAAYVEPASAVDTVSRAVTMPVRPLDRLWVDPTRADSAREVVASEVAELTALLAEQDPDANASGLVHPVPRSAGPRVLAPPPLPDPVRPAVTPPPAPAEDPSAPPGRPSDDDVFAQLVEQFLAESAPPAQGRPWPSREDLPDPGDPPRRRRTDPPGGPTGRSAEPGPGDTGSGSTGTDPGASGRQVPAHRPTTGTPVRPVSWGLPGDARRLPPPPPAAAPPAASTGLPPRGSGSRSDDALDDPDDHFVPPAPPPVPRVRPRTVAATAAVLLGLLVLFDPELLRLPATIAVGLVGLALLAGGATALVWWMQDGDDDDSGDGAVV